MNVLEAIRHRREITQFQERTISEESIEHIMKAAYLSPTGNNLPSREFILVMNKDTLRLLSQSTPYVAWLREAAAAIVITGLPEVSKYWLQDASIASGYIWLAAVERLLGTAYGAVYHAQDAEESTRRERFVRESLDIPSDRRVTAILGLGYPAVHPPAKEMYPESLVIHRERFRHQ